MNHPKSEKIQVKVSDGSTMQTFLAYPPKADRAPTILVLQEVFGVNSHIRDVAERLANEGYFAAAPELFHRTAPVGYEGDYSNSQASMPHAQALTPEGVEADFKAVHEALRQFPQADTERLAAIGFCMGGRAAFRANAVLPLRAAISFYGGGLVQSLPLAERQHGPLLLIWGGLDKHIGPEQHRAVADKLREIKKPFVNVEFSDAEHGFFCNERKSYHPAAAKEAWALTLAFLKANL